MNTSQLAYILAASHSGSTLLALLLGAHPEICTVGELKASQLRDPERYRCACGEPIKQCAFWLEVSARMAEKGIGFEIARAKTAVHGCPSGYARRLLQPLHRGPILEAMRDAALSVSPTWRRHLPETQRRNAALVETLLELTGEKVVVDSSKIAVRLKYLLRNPDLNVRVVRTIRDGRAVALTYVDPLNFADASDPSLRAGGFGGNWYPPKASIAHGAHEWRRSNEEAEALLAQLDRGRWIEVRYEELCADPTATVGKICAFLGLSPEKTVKNFRDVQQHVIGNGMRLDKTSEIRLDERWRTHLRAEQLAEFDAVAGDLNRKYGYT